MAKTWLSVSISAVSKILRLSQRTQVPSTLSAKPSNPTSHLARISLFCDLFKLYRTRAQATVSRNERLWAVAVLACPFSKPSGPVTCKPSAEISNNKFQKIYTITEDLTATSNERSALSLSTSKSSVAVLSIDSSCNSPAMSSGARSSTKKIC